MRPKWQNITFKFSVVIATVVLLSIIELYMHVHNTNTLKRSTVKLQNSQTSIENLLEADRDAYQSNLAVILSIYKHLKNDTFHLDSLKHAAYENLQQIEGRYQKFNLNYTYTKNHNLRVLDSIFWKRFRRLHAETDNIFYLLDAGNQQLAFEKYRHEYLQQFNPMRKALDELTDIHNAASDKSFLAIEQLNQQTSNRTYFVYFFIVLIFIVVSYLSLKSIMRRTQEIEKLTNILTQKNTDLQIANESLECTNEELLSSNEELNVLNDALAEQKRQLEQTLIQLKETQVQLVQSEKNAALGVMVAGLAHELNNPINFVTSSTSALEKYNKNIFDIIREYKQCKSIDDIEKVKNLEKELSIDLSVEKLNSLFLSLNDGAKRTSDLVKRMYMFSQGTEIEISTNINQLIDFCLKLNFSKLENNITIIKNFGNIPRIQCNSAQISHAINNIIKNAIESIENMGVITILTGSTDDEIYISISDTGRGIKEDIKDKIYDPFFTTKPVGKGSGLGLYMVQDIVKRNNGKLVLDTELEKGSTFTLFLPKRIDTFNSPKIVSNNYTF